MFAVDIDTMRQADKLKIEELSRCYNDSVNGDNLAVCALMLNAAKAVAKRIDGYKNILILCGGGNNGGDGYALAVVLQGGGVRCAVVEVLPVNTAAANHYRTECKALNIGIYGELPKDIGEYDCIVDCIYGTGFHGELRGAVADMLDIVNASRAVKAACDIPSGLNGGNGIADTHTFIADMTIAIGAYKVGYYLNDGKDYCGDIYLEDIGITEYGDKVEIAGDNHVKEVFPKRKNNSYKSTYGNLVIVADSANYIGAGLLSYAAAVNVMGESALRVGCGYCRLCVPDNLQTALQSHVVHSCLLPRKDLHTIKPTAIAVGMGLDIGDTDIVKGLIVNGGAPLLIDATAIQILSKNLHWLEHKSCDIIITPHTGEFAKLCGLSVAEVLDNPIALAKQFAAKYGVVVYLKGASSIVTDGERVGLVVNGSPSLAKGGSGDVLSGVISGIMARGIDLYRAALVGGYICAKAASNVGINEYAVTPMDIATAISGILPQ